MRPKTISRTKIEKAVGKSLFERLDREIKAIGKMRVFIFDIESAEELFSAFAIVIGLSLAVTAFGVTVNIQLAKVFFMFTAGMVFITYLKTSEYISKYKTRLMQDNELPAVLNTLAQGLEVGMPVENIMRYIAENKKGTMRDIISEALNKVNAGVPLEKSLEEAAQKSLNKYFMRAVRILGKADETPIGLSVQLYELLSEIEEDKLNQKTARASSLDNMMTFPILIGYFIPLLVMVVLPFVQDLGSIFMIGK
ncbi:tight adherence protein C [Caldanaerobius fijiensis DSM 17918]|uniref:Tight adherence protein C n=1 Tax=Caldanaerobius fijiensis DSM 17918 TaxID=1121256 RepID=A0A1M5BIS8_9THEO|nr:type II secretion system F family protein [Caldanaerobius fijiensis]SHF42260.1 tight adherence protein C [Caldanaerobius fijiensis DSM 17918]